MPSFRLERLVAVLMLCTLVCCEFGIASARRKPRALIPHAQRVVLVTGAAGFIGFHIARRLVTEWRVKQVVVVDSFNNYYDVQLKRDRATELIKMGVKVYRADVCNGEFLHHLMAKHNFTDVVHMAAQAGVRYSLEDPQAYVTSNYQCFISLLDNLLEFPDTYLVYASSSSVYGKRASIPFSIEEPLKAPGNIYAASKIMNEHLAAAYCAQHGLLATGLRFFTVYGPWGRPDMAAYKFAERIVTGRPVPLFDAGPGQTLMRDFTYVDDIVSGVLASLDHTPSRCGEAYNLGYGQPLVVGSMLEYLQKELKKDVIIENLPLPPSDMIITYANISTSQHVLEFRPKTSTAEGIHHFVEWFKVYYKDRVQWEKKGKDSLRNSLLDLALQEADKEMELVEANAVAAENRQYRERVAELRRRYEHAAAENGVLLPSLKKDSFVRYKGLRSEGFTIIKAPAYSNRTELLEARCLATEQCIAFTLDGEFKSRLQPRQLWKTSPHDLFVADVDMCAADLHNCGRNAVCHSTGPGTYQCECHEDHQQLSGRVCIERYVEGKESHLEQEWKLSDYVDGVDWWELTKEKAFVFFPGIDSPGGDYLFVEGGKVEEVTQICRGIQHCLAFNSNGILKHSLRDPRHWVRWTDSPEQGLYVLDVDYCQMGLEQCPTISSCVRSAPGNYSCRCQPPLRMAEDGSCQREQQQEQQQEEAVEEKERIAVILSVDRQHFAGLVAVLHSLWQHSSHPEQLTVHIVVIDEPREALLGYLLCHNLPTDQLTIVELSSQQISSRVRVVDPVSLVGNLASAANFVRFQFPDLFPALHRALYLDADTVVQGDVAEVWALLKASKKLMVVVPRTSITYGKVFNSDVKNLFTLRRGKTFANDDPTFNAGIFGMNFDLWREKNLGREADFWIAQHAQELLWRFGTQPILQLVAYGEWEPLPAEWNVDGLGWNQNLSHEVLNQAKLLHWSGKAKPWLPGGLYRDWWTPHVPSVCGGHGLCQEENSRWRCVCDEGYGGHLCHQHNK